MFQRDGPTFVRGRPGEQLRNDCGVQTVKFGEGGIMMWMPCHSEVLAF